MCANNDSTYVLKRTHRVRIFYIILYIFANIYACIYSTYSGQLLGDYLGFNIKGDTPLITILIAIVFSYWFVCVFLFNFLSNVKVNAIKINNLNVFSCFLLITQVLYMIYNLVADTNSAGSNYQTGGVTRLLWLLYPVDYLFYIYYFLGRDKSSPRIYIINIMIFILSMLTRGWLGWVIILVYAEICFILLKNNKNIIKKYALTLIVLGVVAPVIFSLKIQLRELISGGGDGSVMSLLSNINIIQSYSDFIYSFFSRIQQFSNVLFFYDNRESLSGFINSGYVSHYGWEGLPQQVIAKLFNFDPGTDIHIFLYNHYIANSTEAITTLQVGFISWFFISTLSSVLYPIFVVFLCLFSIMLTKRVGGGMLCALTWIMIFLYIMCGWFNAYLTYTQALLTFYLLQGLPSLFKRQ